MVRLPVAVGLFISLYLRLITFISSVRQDALSMDETHREYEAIGKSDGMLNPERDTSRGFSGIRILWH